MIDGAQGIAHEDIDVTALDADFYVFSGHKIYAPAGIGVLYGKQALLKQCHLGTAAVNGGKSLF